MKDLFETLRTHKHAGRIVRIYAGAYTVGFRLYGIGFKDKFFLGVAIPRFYKGRQDGK